MHQKDLFCECNFRESEKMPDMQRSFVTLKNSNAQLCSDNISPFAKKPRVYIDLTEKSSVPQRQQ